MSQKNLEQELSELYAEVPAPPSGLATGRQRMLAEAARLETHVARQGLPGAQATAGATSTRRRKMNLVLAYKVLAAVMAVVVAVAGLGGGAVLAAESLPGDVLYPVKLLSEDARLALTPDPADRAELVMASVAERVQEMEKLAQQGAEIPAAAVALLTRQMEQAMVEIAKARPEEIPALLERVRERTRLFQETLDRAGTGTGEETQTRLRQASQVMQRTRENAESDPLYQQYQYQHRYEGTPGPHGEATQAPAGTGQQQQEQEQHQYEGTPGPHSESTPAQQQEQERQEEQHRNEGTAGPHGEATATETPGPEETVSPDTDPQRTQQEEQYRHEGTPGPHGEQGTPSTEAPRPTETGKQGR
jgi:hypothetical protein